MNIVVTGGSRGIGNGLVKYFLKNNHNVTFTGTRIESIEKAEKELVGSFQGVVCNVTNTDDIINLYQKALSKYGEIDVWINNAGVNNGTSVYNLSFDEIDKLIDINVKGMMYCTSYVLDLMVKAGHGAIYNMEGLGSDGRMIPTTILYGSSKRLLRYFSRGADKELKSSKVFVGTLSPGMVFTDLLLKDANEDSLKIINILADDVETVTNYLGKNIEKGKKNINWLTTRKIMKKFIFASFKKRIN